MIGSIIAVGIAFAGLLLFERDLPTEVVDAQYANAQSQFLRTDENDRIHFRDQGLGRGSGYDHSHQFVGTGIAHWRIGHQRLRWVDLFQTGVTPRMQCQRL